MNGAYAVERFGIFGMLAPWVLMVLYFVSASMVAAATAMFAPSLNRIVFSGMGWNWTMDAITLFTVGGSIASIVCAFAAGWVRQYWVAYAGRQAVELHDPAWLDGMARVRR